MGLEERAGRLHSISRTLVGRAVGESSPSSNQAFSSGVALAEVGHVLVKVVLSRREGPVKQRQPLVGCGGAPVRATNRLPPQYRWRADQAS